MVVQPSWLRVFSRRLEARTTTRSLHHHKKLAPPQGTCTTTSFDGGAAILAACILSQAGSLHHHEKPAPPQEARTTQGTCTTTRSLHHHKKPAPPQEARITTRRLRLAEGVATIRLPFECTMALMHLIFPEGEPVLTRVRSIFVPAVIIFVLLCGLCRAESTTTTQVAGGGATRPASDAARRPNIVLIFADDLGWKDTSYQGSDFYETPNIDRLANEGMVFPSLTPVGPIALPAAPV